MELTEVGEYDIKSGKQIVIVDFDGNGKKCLTFLVTDCEKPQVPGYPCIGLSYYETVEEARKAIIELYDKIGYPKNDCYKGTFTRKRG